MKIAPRFLSAAFAIAAVVATPFVTPAQPAAAGNETAVADVGISLSWAGASDQNNRRKTDVVIHNKTGAHSGRVTVATFCGYKLPGAKAIEKAAQPVQSLASLTPHQHLNYSFWCPTNAGFPAEYSRIEVRADNENNMSNNKLQTSLTSPHN